MCACAVFESADLCVQEEPYLKLLITKDYASNFHYFTHSSLFLNLFLYIPRCVRNNNGKCVYMYAVFMSSASCSLSLTSILCPRVCVGRRKAPAVLCR